MPRLLLFALLLALLDSLARAATSLPPQIVSATRAPKPAEHIASTVHVFDTDNLRHAPTLSLDAALRSLPAFSLFRRSDSLTANPTAQGVSLRGLGPSGASRSLVLFNDIPLNDPFGGWIAWTKLPRETLLRAELVPGGGATAWGNAALGGVVHLRGQRAPESQRVASLLVGDYGTRSAELSTAHRRGDTTLALAGKIFSTDGFSLVAPERRGPIDIGAWSRHRWLSATAAHRAAGIDFSATARTYAETRGNGTPYQQNRSRENFLSLAAAAQPTADFAWDATAYAQDQTFASTFSAVNATRTAETPASDQYDVPSTAFGAAWTGALHHGNARTSFGTDARFVRGETRENFTFANGAFTRQRIAGGRQRFAGLFALHERPLTSTLRATLGARLDTWSDTHGQRRETDRITGVILRRDRYADRDGTAFSPSAGLVWSPAAAWRLRANAQHAFRRPTLNELYRPFRVGPNVTEANPALDTERVTSTELGAEWSPSLNSHPSTLNFSATAFHNDLRDAVGNVTLARGPGTFPIVGFIAAGGVGRQRLNLDRTRVRGFELGARWHPSSGTTLTADYLYNDARVTRSTLAPALVGKRLAQVPRQAAALGASVLLPARFTLTPRLRWIDRQFEDDENQLILGSTIIADLSLSRPLTKHLELYLTCENLGDARIETGRTADGLVNTGTPRLLLAGLRGTW